ncbi:hypothetical protein Dimus_003707, partial [Dionaea muscipula]
NKNALVSKRMILDQGNQSTDLAAYYVPLDDKQGEEPKSYDYFEETFLTMCQLKREQGVWWLGLGVNRRRDVDETPAKNVQNEEVANKGQKNQGDFDWVQVDEEAELQGEEQAEKEAKVEDFGSGEKFFDAMDDVEDPAGVTAPTVPDVPVPVPNQQKGKTAARVDPSG